MSFVGDKAALVGILQFTEKLFDHLIQRMPPEDRTRFQEAWNLEVRAQLHQVIATLNGVQSEQEPVWEKLAASGLTGRSLNLKRHYLATSASNGFLKKFLKFLNSLLQSLITGIPGAEPIKELKDYIESFFDEVPEPDNGLTTLFNMGGFVPFGMP